MSNLVPKAYAESGAPVTPAAQTVYNQAQSAGRTTSSPNTFTYSAPAGPGNGSYQNQWQAAGHSGIAPVGYHGESTSSGPSPEQQLLDSAFNAQNDYLNQAEGAIKGAQPGILQGINQGTDTALTNLGASNTAAMGQIDQSQQAGEQRKQDALVAARRLYNELVMGGQQRFGGSSSAGEAYGALTGRELQRNTAQTNTDFSTFMGQVQTAKTNLQTQYENGLRTLEQQRQDALRQAERDYQDKLLSIASDRSQAAGAKANSQLQLLQQLRNNVYAINVAQAQNTGTLQKSLQDAQAQLNQYTAQISPNVGAVNQGQQAFSANTTTAPKTGLAINTAGGSAPTFNPTGAINPDQRKNDQFGFNFA